MPNAISLARLAATPLVVWLILAGLDAWALAAFAVAALSDAVDGAIAKLANRSTTLGAYLDPLADKALLVGTYLSLAARDALPLWLVILVVSRDIVIVGGALLEHVLTHRLRPDPMLISKLNTLAQITLAVAALGRLAFDLGGGIWFPGLLGVVAFTTAASAAAYVVRWSRRVSDGGHGTA